MIESGLGIPSPLFFIGVVENNVDERLEGRCQVRAFGIHGTNTEITTADLPWATPIVPDVNFTPYPVNTFVIGFFIDGRDAQQPMILGIIPTQMLSSVNPALQGYGAIPNQNYDRLGMSRRPQDLGQPTMSRMARAEYIQETNVLTQEAGRVTGIPVAGSSTTFEQPTSAYNAEYPYNRVIESASGHSIEMDDTPGAERIRIFHRSGSFVEIDSRGTTTEKAVSDKYEINDRNMHVYIGGRSIITIEGDSHVLVKGNKIEEIYGDYQQIVHGNHEISVAGQANVNAGDEIQMRAARVGMESNVEAMNLFTAKAIVMTSGEAVHFKAPIVSFESEGDLNIKAKDIRIGGGDSVHVNAKNVYIDDMVSLANGDAEEPEEALEATQTRLAEPATRSAGGGLTGVPNGTSGVASGASAGGYGAGGGSSGGGGPALSSGIQPHVNEPSMGSTGIASTEQGDIPTHFVSNCSTDLIEYLKKTEAPSGFHATPYWDYKQWTSGYGTRANSENEIINEATADSRLRIRVDEDRRYIIEQASRNGRNWNDCQIDAMCSFIFNGGRGWLSQVTNNWTRNDAEVQAKMLEYNKAGGVALGGLTSRRKFESDWFGAGRTGGSVSADSAPTNSGGNSGLSSPEENTPGLR